MARYRVQITTDDGRAVNKETDSLREIEERWVPLLGSYTRLGLVVHIEVYDGDKLNQEWEY